jgi:putative FmdB family regulatory protein
MPIFEYVCKECQHEFEALLYGAQKAECPKCRGKKLEPQLSVFAVSAKSGGKSGEKSGGSTQPTFSSGSCGSCGDPRGPGACSLNDLD